MEESPSGSPRTLSFVDIDVAEQAQHEALGETLEQAQRITEIEKDELGKRKAAEHIRSQRRKSNGGRRARLRPNPALGLETGSPERRERRAKARDERQNLRTEGVPRAQPPSLIPPEEASAALNSLLADDSLSLKEERLLRAKHAQAALLKPSRHRAPRKAERKRLEETLGEAEWLAVYDAFARTGVSSQIVELTSLSLEAVEHLLEVGVLRLNLPPVRDHASRTEAVHKSLVAGAQGQIQDHTAEASGTNLPQTVEQAITTRAVRESAAAQQCLEASINANEIFSAFVDKILAAVRAGAIEVGEPIRMAHLETLSKALVANTQALERAVKLSRLVRGETTDLVGAQISVLLQSCSLAELEEAERSGSIPRRLINRFAGGSLEEGVRPPLIIDMPVEAAAQAEPGEPEKEAYAPPPKEAAARERYTGQDPVEAEDYDIADDAICAGEAPDGASDAD